jgi:hypothetical protein
VADIAATDVTYTLQEGTQKASPSDPRFQGVFTLAFGNGALTIPAGGVPLTRAKLGCPSRIEEFIIMDEANANGFTYKYDASNNKIRVYQGDSDGVADGPGVEVTAAPAATSVKVKVVGW